MKKYLFYLLTIAITIQTVLAQAPAPVIWNGALAKFLPQTGWKLFDGKEYISLAVDPSAGAGVAAPIGSIGVRDNAGVGEAWFKYGAGNTSWSSVLLGNTGWSLLGNAATNPGINFLGTTDAQDLVLKTNSNEHLRITSAGQFQFSPNEMYVQGALGAIGSSYNALNFQQTFSTINGNYSGPYLANGFNNALTGGYQGFTVNDTWAAGSSNTYMNGFSFNPNVQAGSSIGNMQFFNATPNIPAGTMTTSTISGVQISPIINSDISGYNGLTSQPTINSTYGYYNGFSEIPQFGASSVFTTNYKSFQAQPTIANGATFQSGIGYFSGANIGTGVTINDYTGFQDSTTLGSNLTNYNGIIINPQSNGDVTNLNMVSLSPNLSGNQTNAAAININGSIGNNITNYTGVNVNNSATGTITNVTGVRIDNSQLNSPNQKTGLNINDGSLNVNSQYDTSVLPDSLNFLSSLNYIGGNFKVASGHPVTGNGAMIANNLAPTTSFDDNMPVDFYGGLIGFTAVGFVGQLSVAAGKTVDHINMALGGAGVPAASTGGAITSADMFSAAGLLNQGGTVDVTGQMVGFHTLSNLCSMVSGECFGIKVEGNAQAEFSYGVELATSVAQPACASTNRGQLWVVQGGVGVADNYQICEKNAANAYVWTDVNANSNNWSITGNAGTTAGTNFVGTTDAQDLVIKANSVERLRAQNGGGVTMQSGLYQFGTSDAFARKQIWDYDTNSILRLGSWGQDGDATNASSEGIVVYGASLTGQPISATDGGYARIKQNRFGLYTVDSTLPSYTGGNYFFITDDTSLYYRDNSGVKSFEVTRSTGAVVANGDIESKTSLTLEDPGAGTNTTKIQAGTVTASYTVTLPPAQGAASTTLVNDGAGNLSWSVVSQGPTLFGTRSSGRSIVAATGITSGSGDMSTTVQSQIVFVYGSGGVDITANPQIQAGTSIGQDMIICGTDNTNYLILENGNGLSLNGSITLGKDDCITLRWLGSDGSTSDWVEISRNN